MLVREKHETLLTKSGPSWHLPAEVQGSSTELIGHQAAISRHSRALWMFLSGWEWNKQVSGKEHQDRISNEGGQVR